jgi:hypothetical protein
MSSRRSRVTRAPLSAADEQGYVSFISVSAADHLRISEQDAVADHLRGQVRRSGSHNKMATVSTATATSPDGPATATAAYSGPPQGTEQEAGVKRKVAGWRHFVAGGVGGMTGAIVTSPFDVVKVSRERGAKRRVRG